MTSFRRLWNSVVGDGRGMPPQEPSSTIPRDVLSSRAASSFVRIEDSAAGDDRASDRFVPAMTTTSLTTATGKRVAARIINMSRNGVVLEPEPGTVEPREVVMVGTRPVRPGRVVRPGMVFLFEKPIDPKLYEPNIVL